MYKSFRTAMFSLVCRGRFVIIRSRRREGRKKGLHIHSLLRPLKLSGHVVRGVGSVTVDGVLSVIVS